MAQQMIADRVGVGRRYLRAVDLLRDLADPAALDGYVLTPSVREASGRLLGGLAEGSTQRAFRVTGAYGSGKSSFALFIARLFSGDPSAKRLVGEAGVKVERLPSYRPLVLSGRRASMADEIVRIVLAAAEAMGHDGEATARLARGLVVRRADGHRDIAPVLDLLDRYADSVASASGMGVLLLIDEMGRFLEYTAANQASEDPTLFQRLAERAGGSTGSPLAIVGFLHQRFADYVAGMGDWIEGEWARSAERYEELAFHESTEQTLFLLGQALVPSEPHSRAVAGDARRLFTEAAGRRLFATGLHALTAVSPRVYPLHPAAIALLSASSRRFGQNERSVFSFVQSLEPAGLQRHSIEHEYGVDSWYRLNSLHDYLASQGALNIRARDRARRWELSLDAVREAADMGPGDLAVLKTLSMLVVLEPTPGLPADADTIAWCLDVEEDEVEAALHRLSSRGLIHKRSTSAAWSLWSASSVDLEHWVDKARSEVPAIRNLDDVLRTLPPSRPVVAHRHYHRTGTLRTFGITTGKHTPNGPTDHDGCIVVVPVMPDEDATAERERILAASKVAGPLVVHRLRPFTPADLNRVRELASWRWISASCDELRMDDIARAEVAARVEAAEAAVDAVLATLAVDEAVGDVWIWNGAEVEISSRGDLSRLLSGACDVAFPDAPVLRNELINRTKLSSAIAAARMTLLGRMLTDADREYLGLEGAPPERTIHLSMFHASHLHRRVGDAYAFMAPDDEDPNNWAPSWQKIDDLLAAGMPVRLDAIVSELSVPPIGLRGGPALLLVTAYLISRRRDVAVLERNTFQPELTPAHFMRLAKTPANFSIHLVSREQDPQAILDALAERFTIWPKGRRPEATVKAVVHGLYAWWNGLSEYALETKSVSEFATTVRQAIRKATNPVELLFETLPGACSVETRSDPMALANEIAEALREIDDAPELLRRRVVATLNAAFGTATLKDLRSVLRIEYAPRAFDLTEYRLRAFVDRASNAQLEETIWLDGVASLLAGRRLDGWGDDTLDGFSFEARILAQRLRRWLATMLAHDGQPSGVTAVHMATPDGEEVAYYMHESKPSRERDALEAEVRRVLGDSGEAADVLASLLREKVAGVSAKVKAKVKQ